MAKTIQLTRGMLTVVDDDDFVYLSTFNWRAAKRCGGKRYYFYATRTFKLGSIKLHIAMHREIMLPPEGMYVDHANGNTLDNRKENLRLATHKDNSRNCRQTRQSSAGFRGVRVKVLSRGRLRYSASIKVNKKSFYIGTFDTPREAALAYNKKASECFGGFAVLNKLSAAPSVTG